MSATITATTSATTGATTTVNHRTSARPSGGPSADTYRRRRTVVGVVVAIVVAFGSVVTHDVLVGSGGVPASAAESRPARVRSTITAQPGDTLWSIAQTHRGAVSVHRFVDKLVDLNGGASIQAGQQVVLP